MNFKEIGIPTIVLVAICLVITAVLAATYEATKVTIAEGAIARTNAMCEEIYPGATFDELEVPVDAAGIIKILEAKTSGSTEGYLFTSTSSGYGGYMEFLVAINTDGTVKSIRILSDNETPGLGKNAAEDFFTSQYYVKPDGDFTVVKSNKATDTQILSLSGATITSKAVTDAVNSAYGCFKVVGGVI